MSEVLAVEAAPGGYVNPYNDRTMDEKAIADGVHRSYPTRPSDLPGNVEEKDPTLGTAVEVKETEREVDEADEFVKDPFKPFNDLPPERDNILTIRAVLVGLICGALVNASNIYLGLKTGWTFTANLFGAIVGFAVLKACAKTFGEHFPILGGSFGPRENNIVQTAATAAGGMSNVFVSAIPAMYQLKLLNTPQADYTRLITFTLVGGFWGLFFATPLRKFFIIYVARELRMVFPTPSATAMTIRSMHGAATGELVAKMKMKALSYAFAAAFVLRIASQYAIGVLWDWHIFTWFYIWGHYNNAALAVENWGWYIEWTPAFIGVGILVGLNVSLSFFAGSVVAWGIIGPALVHNGAAFGIPADVEEVGQQWAPITSFYSLAANKFGGGDKFHPSPRFWLLWPGVLCMIAVSFTELACQWRVFLYGGRAIFRASCKAMAQYGPKSGRSHAWFENKASKEDQTDTVEDPAPDHQQVKWWIWAPGLVLSVILTCVVMGVQYQMPVGMSLLAIFLSFFFSFLAIQCTGATDITPLTAASKASQIVLGGATKGEHWVRIKALRLNLLGGAVANIGSDQSSSLVSDFRVGFLLRTPPNLQWYAQCIGTVVAVFIAPGMYVLFSAAYPCINDLNAKSCPFFAPSVSAWRAVAVAVIDPKFPVPTSSGIFSIVFSVLGSIMILIRHYVLVGKRAYIRAYWPNAMVFALAFLIPQTVYGTANVIGAVAAIIWAKRSKKTFDVYGFAVAAGLIAGEGIGGVINAIFQVAGISGDFYGWGGGCPTWSC